MRGDDTRPHPLTDALTGAVMACLTLAVIGVEWGGSALAGTIAVLLAGTALALNVARVGRTGKIFVGVGLALTAAAAAVHGDWRSEIAEGLAKAAFIGAFFTALTTLRHAADTSASIARCGRFLAEQPPGRRYLALTAGGHLFALPLSYGGIALLGGLSLASAGKEPNEEIRLHRIRRMLLAIQRGFISSLPWSPLSFAVAISTSLVPGASWGNSVLPCAISGLILLGLGWALDTIFKPRLSTALPPRKPSTDNWSAMRPLIVLLTILVLSVGSLALATGIRAVGVVMLVVPLLSAGWILIQSQGNRVAELARRTGLYLSGDLSRYRGEIVLLMMAGFIGTVGSRLLAPVMEASGLDLTVVPSWVILLAFVWGIPLTGQIGMNPILAVSLVAPVLPAPEALGLTAPELIVAITAGWAISGASSPYTATTLLIGAFGDVSPRHVGLVWNGLYIALAGVILSAWSLIFAALW